MSEHSRYRDGSGEPPGPLADEAARLVGAAQDWWHRTVGAGTATAAATAAAAGNAAGIATGSPECCWCPVCQAIATFRGERPDLLERLTETQAALSGLLRALIDPAATGRATPPADQPPHNGEPPQAGSRASRVQRIPLNTDPGTDGTDLGGSGPALDPQPHPTAFDAAAPEQDPT